MQIHHSLIKSIEDLSAQLSNDTDILKRGRLSEISTSGLLDEMHQYVEQLRDEILKAKKYVQGDGSWQRG
jgi:hypothetical protein